MDIQVGSIVYVLSGRCRFWHEWAIVDEIKGEGEAMSFHLRFGKGVGSIMDRPSEFWHERIDLEVHAEMPLAARADYQFGKMMWHSIYSLPKPFGEGCVCMHCSHDGEPLPPSAVKRLLLNASGAACEFDVCAAHTDMEKFWYEVLPETKRSLRSLGY